MKTLYFDCGMGAAGDMLTAALLELLPDPDSFLNKLNALGIPGVEYTKEKSEKCGIVGTHISVKVHGTEESEDMHEHHHHEHEHHHHGHGHGHPHHHSGMDDIRHIITGHCDLPAKVAEDVLNVYSIIAEAESHVHGLPVSDIHFHEVGTMDAVADITAVCMLISEISPDEVVASPVHVGSGQVKCAHGILPVPAPATAYILRDVPIYGGKTEGELCTPTGAALLKYFASRFDLVPAMAVKAIGYGMGKKDFEAANCVRALLGETADSTDAVCELACNIDDMTAEDTGFAMERLFEGGALEVYTVPITMKKSRPGIKLCVLCKPDDRDRIIGLIYRHTTTIGVRETLSKRYILDRSAETVSTEYGDVRLKKSTGYGVCREKFEYEDIARIAKENGLSLSEVRANIKKKK
ncbi:MAG: nickel pincer cofactor biosynthesis protein LarC [Clostridia bacterium]|nr:nickel pincer cofactor biosynthesis protein LarC [Clostridia bacterium]